MTLILSLITDDFIIHASDRRLTDGRTGRQMTTKAAKTVICPQAKYMVSFTGLAHISPPMTTGEWLMRTLWENKDRDLFETLACAAGKAIEALRIPTAVKRHSFIVSGWLQHMLHWEANADLPKGFIPGPFAALVSNSHDLSAFGETLREPQPVFTHLGRVLLPDERFVIVSVGAELTRAEQESLDRDISSALRSSGGRERAAALLMVRTIESVAKRDPTVGGGAFVAAIPRHYRPDGAQPDRPHMNVLGALWGLPEAGAATFVHIPDQPTKTVESPYILADPFSGIATLTIHSGPVPGLTPLTSEVPDAGEIRMKIIPWRSTEELAAMARQASPT
jgi:hypothetical protein